MDIIENAYHPRANVSISDKKIIILPSKKGDKKTIIDMSKIIAHDHTKNTVKKPTFTDKYGNEGQSTS